MYASAQSRIYAAHSSVTNVTSAVEDVKSNFVITLEKAFNKGEVGHLIARSTLAPTSSNDVQFYHGWDRPSLYSFEKVSALTCF